MSVSKNIQLVLAILNECRDISDVTEMKLYKLMYFCETNYFLKFEERLTRTRFLKNNLGPTPCYPPSFFKELKEYVELIKKEYLYYFLKHEVNAEKLAKDINYDFIREEVKKYKYLSALELSNLSHQDTPFLMAKYKGVINIEDVIYRDEEESNPEELDKERQQFEKAFSGKNKAQTVNKINQILQECHP